MTTIECDIVLLPDAAITQEAIKVSQGLASLGSAFTLEIGKRFPHMSLYMLSLDSDSLTEARRLLANFGATTDPISPDPVGAYEIEGFICMEYERTDELIRLQTRVLEAFNPLRTGMVESEQQASLQPPAQPEPT